MAHVRRPFAAVAATAEEVRAPRPGDDLVPRADVVMDRGFDAPGTPEQVWPWLVQLGKGRGGWYFPRAVERFVPRSRRATRSVQPQWQGLAGRRRHPRLRRSRGVLRGRRGRASPPPRLPLRARPDAGVVGDHPRRRSRRGRGCTCASGSGPYDGSGWPRPSGSSSTPSPSPGMAAGLRERLRSS